MVREHNVEHVIETLALGDTIKVMRPNGTVYFLGAVVSVSHTTDSSANSTLIIKMEETEATQLPEK